MAVQTKDFKKFFEAPAFRKAGAFEAWRPGLRPLFYDCGEWSGRKVEVFAWLGLPKLAPGEKCPAVVLVHGGGGTAFADWVELWNSRGYAAIAMDTCGGAPCWSENAYSRPLWPRHERSGPAGWGDFASVDKPVEEQWPYQAVSSVIAACSLLRSLPEVDVSKIGVTGVSWGGILTCIASGLDERFAFAAPVYGCGFLKESVPADWSCNDKWLSLWDPSLYLPDARMPFLWTVGTNDFAFNLQAVSKSAALLKTKPEFCVPVRMAHGHGGIGEKPPEILNFANRTLGFGESVESPGLSETSFENGVAAAAFKRGWKASKAEINWTVAGGAWPQRLWETAPASLEDGRVSASLPSGATALYFNVYSESGLIFSSRPLMA